MNDVADVADKWLGFDPPDEPLPIEIEEPEPVTDEPLAEEEDLEAAIRQERIRDAQRRGRASLLRSEDPAMNTTSATGLSIK